METLVLRQVRYDSELLAFTPERTYHLIFDTYSWCKNAWMSQLDEITGDVEGQQVLVDHQRFIQIFLQKIKCIGCENPTPWAL